MDLLIITIPMKNIAELPKDLQGGLPESAVVVDTCNYYPGRDGVIEAIESGLTESDWVAQQLGHPVIKVFQKIVSLPPEATGQEWVQQARSMWPGLLTR